VGNQDFPSCSQILQIIMNGSNLLIRKLANNTYTYIMHAKIKLYIIIIFHVLLNILKNYKRSFVVFDSISIFSWQSGFYHLYKLYMLKKSHITWMLNEDEMIYVWFY
jgi:hypothetical protein